MSHPSLGRFSVAEWGPGFWVAGVLGMMACSHPPSTEPPPPPTGETNTARGLMDPGNRPAPVPLESPSQTRELRLVKVEPGPTGLAYTFTGRLGQLITFHRWEGIRRRGNPYFMRHGQGFVPRSEVADRWFRVTFQRRSRGGRTGSGPEVFVIVAIQPVG